MHMFWHGTGRFHRTRGRMHELFEFALTKHRFPTNSNHTPETCIYIHVYTYVCVVACHCGKHSDTPKKEETLAHLCNPLIGALGRSDSREAAKFLAELISSQASKPGFVAALAEDSFFSEKDGVYKDFVEGLASNLGVKEGQDVSTSGGDVLAAELVRRFGDAKCSIDEDLCNAMLSSGELSACARLASTAAIGVSNTTESIQRALTKDEVELQLSAMLALVTNIKTHQAQQQGEENSGAMSHILREFLEATPIDSAVQTVGTFFGSATEDHKAALLQLMNPSWLARFMHFIKSRENAVKDLSDSYQTIGAMCCIAEEMTYDVDGGMLTLDWVSCMW